MILTAPLLAQFPWLFHGFSTRRGGVSSFDSPGDSPGDSVHSSGDGADLNLGHLPWDNRKNVLENRRRLLARLAAKDMQLVLQRQIHSDLIRVLDDVGTGLQACPACPERRRRKRSRRACTTTGKPALPVLSAVEGSEVEGNACLTGAAVPAPPAAGDGLMTHRPGLLLGVLVADCLPILLVDAKQRVVAALHCGWRGTVRRLAEKAIGRMRLLFGSRPEDLWAAIGPGIGACCYAVGPEVAEEFTSQFRYGEQLLITKSRPLSPLEIKRAVMVQPLRSNFGPREKKEIHLDLPRANGQQLRDAGVPTRQIYSASLCTSCHPELFFSHRRDGGRTGRMMGAVGIRAERRK